jgi:hypothetical protein
VEHHRRGYLSAPGLTPTGADRWGREPWGPLCSGSDACCWGGEGRGMACGAFVATAAAGEREREKRSVGPPPGLALFSPCFLGIYLIIEKRILPPTFGGDNRRIR